MLTSNRTAECYRAIFDYIEQNVFELQPASFMTDWEIGLRSALKQSYPNAVIRGCWWHFRRAVHKKCVNFGFHYLLKTNPDARMIKQQLMSLPLLPPDKFEEGYACVKSRAAELQLSNQMLKLFAYFESYWIAEV